MDIENGSGILQKGSIVARIIDESAGLKVISDVRAVRIHSKGYVLLIMDDYAPTLGEVEGDVSLLSGDDEIVFRGIKGCYKQQNNIFTMIIEERMATGDNE